MLSTKTIKTIAASALLATTILSGSAANAGDSGKNYFSLTGEYLASAKADGNVSANIGSAPLSVDFKNGMGGMVAFGYYLTDNVRTELEGGYRVLKGKTESITIAGTTYTFDASATKAKAFSGMGNIYYDFPTGSNLTPYVGAGIGWAHETDNGGADALAYQGMLGVSYKVSNNSTVFGGYRYLGTTDFSTSYNVAGIAVTQKASIEASAIDVGYRYSF